MIDNFRIQISFSDSIDNCIYGVIEIDNKGDRHLIGEYDSLESAKERIREDVEIYEALTTIWEYPNLTKLKHERS